MAGGAPDRRRAALAIACLFVGAACGDDAALPDASNDAAAGAGDAGLVPAAPAPPAPVAADPALPALPVLVPCPPGWREVEEPGSATVCDPWPASGRASCGPFEAHFPGEPGCTPI